MTDGDWTCDTYNGVGNTAFGFFEEIAEECCYCGGGVRTTGSSAAFFALTVL